jgi:hypothetical protein
VLCFPYFADISFISKHIVLGELHPYNIISYIEDSLFNFFPTPPYKIGTAKGRRLLIATHLDQSDRLAYQPQDLGFWLAFHQASSILYKNAQPETYILLSQTNML